VGLQTMQNAIASATARERGKTRVLLFAVVLLVTGLMLVVAAGGGTLWWMHNENLKKDMAKAQADAATAKEEAAKASGAVAEALARNEKSLGDKLAKYEQEMQAIEGKIGAGESRVARLIVEIQERDRALQEIKQRQDLSETQRQEMVAETQKRLSDLKDQLKKSETEIRGKAGGASWSELAKRYKRGIFLCVAVNPETKQGGIGTAFCVRADGLLATNAHVVKLMQEMPARVVIQNDTGQIFDVERMCAHPDHEGVMSPDVGLIQVKGPVTFPAIPVAEDEELRKLEIGTQLGTIGYPGELQEAYLANVDMEKRLVKTALATFKDGWIGRMTNYKLERAESGECVLLQHSASLSGGTSGSPMFTSEGKVVALNNGGLTTQVVGNAGGSTTVAAIPSAAEIGFAIRADELRKFMKKTGW
jgi:S1-C subfamily serine protease